MKKLLSLVLSILNLLIPSVGIKEFRYLNGFFTGKDITNASSPSMSANAQSSTLTANEGSGCIINYKYMMIYGLAESITDLSGYIHVETGYQINVVASASCGCGTGTIVNVLDVNSEIVESYKIVIFGDVNGDAVADGRDASIVNMIINGMLREDQVGQAVFFAADANHDGFVNHEDESLLCASGLCSALIQQQTDIEPSDWFYTIRFVDYDGTILSSNSVRKGADAPLPANPVRNGYIFAGWSGQYRNVMSNAEIIPNYIPSGATNIFSINSTSGNTGDTVKLLVTLGGTVKTCGFDLRMKYDNSVLDFISLNTDWDIDVLANHMASTSEVWFNFCASANKTVTKRVVEATFKIRDTAVTDTVVKLSAIDVLFADSSNSNYPTPVEFNLADGVVLINQ